VAFTTGALASWCTRIVAWLLVPGSIATAGAVYAAVRPIRLPIDRLASSTPTHVLPESKSVQPLEISGALPQSVAEPLSPLLGHLGAARESPRSTALPLPRLVRKQSGSSKGYRDPFSDRTAVCEVNELTAGRVGSTVTYCHW
jgi:hypothetical protein